MVSEFLYGFVRICRMHFISFAILQFHFFSTFTKLWKIVNCFIFFFSELFSEGESEDSERDTRDAFSDSEDMYHRSMAAKRYASRISSTSSWHEYFKPNFTQKLTFKYILEGEPVVFTCKLIACPTPEMTWFHNSRPIPTGLRRVITTESDLHHHSSSLEISRVQVRDSGTYKLLAINSEGSTESAASLHVIQKGQDKKYLEFLKRAEQKHENVESLAQFREDRIKVDLRFTGSPFNKKQDVEQKGMMRTIHFKTVSPGKKTDWLCDEDYLETKSDVGVNVGESFLDEETKEKLQRLREARKILVERKKLSLLDMSEEYSQTLRNKTSDKDILFSREEIKERSAFDITENGDKIDHSSEGAIYSPHVLSNQTNKNIEYEEPPTSFHTMVDAEILQTEINMNQVIFQKENLPKDHLYDRILVEKNTQTGGQIMPQSNIVEESKCITNVYKNKETYETPKEEPQYIMAQDNESFDTLTNIEENKEIYNEEIRSNDLRELQYFTATKIDEIKTREEEAKVRFLEKSFQNRPQRCPPSLLQEIRSQELYEGESCKFVCHFQGYPQPIVTWYNNDRPIPRNQGFIIQTSENYSTLICSSVLPQNEGLITCVLFNQYGTVKTSCMLKVKAKQRHDFEAHKISMFQNYKDEEEELALVFDQEKIIHSSLQQEGQTNFHTLKTNPPVSSSENVELLSFPVEIQITAATPTPEQDKELRAVFQHEELEHKATPQSEGSQSQKHKFVFSSDITNEPPKMLQEVPKHASCREGDSIILECLLRGEPQPIVTWFQNGVPLMQNQKFQFEEVNYSYRLYITDVNIQDSGEYKCVAENDSGTIESASYLTVEPVTQTEYGQLENTDEIYVKYSKDQHIQEDSERARFLDYQTGSFISQPNVKEYSVREYFQSLETVEEIDQIDQFHSASSREHLSRFLQDASRSTKVNKPFKEELMQYHDIETKECVNEKSKIHHAEEIMNPLVDDFSGTKRESMQECTQSDYLWNIHSERTSGSYNIEDPSIFEYEEPLKKERQYLGKKVKHRIIAFEKLQQAERGTLDRRPIRKSSFNIPQGQFDVTNFPLKQKKPVASSLSTYTQQAEQLSPNTEVYSSSIVTNLKLLSSPSYSDSEVHKREQQKEVSHVHRPSVIEKAKNETPITFDLKLFHSQIEHTNSKFQELDSNQEEKTYLKVQNPSSETSDAENIVFDLKQMFSHIGDPTKDTREQETRKQQENYYKEEILISKTLKSDILNTSSDEQKDISTNPEISSSLEFLNRTTTEKGHNDEDNLHPEKEIQHMQEHNLEFLSSDISFKHLPEEIQSKSCSLLQTSSAVAIEEVSIFEEKSSVENGNQSFISQLKKAASEENLLEVCELEEKSLESAFASPQTQDGEIQGYASGTLENLKHEEEETIHRKLSLSQCLPFLMSEEQQNLNEEIAEKTNVSGEEQCYREVQVQNETYFSNTDIEKTETSFSDQLPKSDESHTMEIKEPETSLTQYLLSTGKHEIPECKDTKHKAKLIRSASVPSMEVEEVTFNTVYEYYKQRQESLDRPYSPESEVSIDLGSTSSEELSELDQFYTPPSSVEHFETPKSPDLYLKQSLTNSDSEIPKRTLEETTERYSTPSEGEEAERYSTPPGETLERFSTPPGETLERFSTPPGETLERFSTPPGETLERFSTPPGETLERYSTPVERDTVERYYSPSGESNSTVGLKKFSSKIEREDSTPNEHFHTPTGERSSAYDIWRSDSFGTPNEAIEPKDNEMPPSFIEPLTKRKIYENTTLGFIIEVEGLPVPDVKWYRNKSLLEPNERIRIERVGNVCSLEISNMQKADEGVYMCHAVNIIGEAKSFSNVDIVPQKERVVALPPPVTHQHVMEFDLENTTSSRTPSPQEIVLEVELSEKDVKEFEKQVKIVTVPEFTPDHKSMIVNLDVLPLNLADPNMASRGEDNKDLNIDLEAFEMPPRFIMPICDFKIPENSDALFKCSVIGIPRPEVKWYKEYMCIKPDNGKYVISDENGSHTLKIRNICLSDCATYRCRAINSAGEAICRGFLTMGDSEMFAMITKKSKVILSSLKEELLLRNKYSGSFFEFQVVDGPPRFIKGISNCHAPLGMAAYFQCLVRGSPRPTARWYKDGKLIEGARFSAEESGIGFHNLFITNLGKNDAGEYKCVAINESGTAESCATLTLT